MTMCPSSWAMVKRCRSIDFFIGAHDSGNVISARPSHMAGESIHAALADAA